MIVQTILEIQAGTYPFDEVISQGSKGMVEELEFFQSKEMLTHRKNQLKKHLKSIQSSLIIKLVKIYEEDLCLHYIYEHVPFSLGTYIKNQLLCDEYDKFKDMTAKLLFRKLTNDINAIAAELSKLRIEAEFLYEKLGVQENKVKLYIGSHFQVGRKSQLLLKDYYRPRKEMVLKILEQQFFRVISDAIDTPNFVIKGNRLLFGNNSRRQSSILNHNIAPSVYSDSNENSFCLNDTYFNCQTKDSQMNNTKQKERRYSQTKIDANQWKRIGKEQEKLRNTQSPAFVGQTNFDNKSKMAKSKHFDDSVNSQDENFDGKSYCHSKSIRIELQKNKNRRHRKDSYKVKIITTHEYQMDDINTKDLFKKCNISDSQSVESNSPKNRNKHKSPQKRQFEQKVHKAAQKAKQILNGYLHRRRNSRK